MKLFVTTLLLTLASLTFAIAPKHEIRGAWLTTVWRLDWPSTVAKDSLSAEKQRREFVKIVERLHFLNFNTVFLQVRLRNDLIYPSQMESISAMISGKAGKSPGYDPLAFAISECHKRGLECHAWLVTIPIGSDKQVKLLGDASLTKTHPELCKRIKGEWFLNPGEPQTANYLAMLTAELTQNYDIDGIHLDYLRYPEIGEFPDNDTFRKYESGQKKADWRRQNINDIVTAIYDTVKTIKPWVQVSSSPIGKWDDLDSVSSLGWNGRSKVFQDAKAWFSLGKQDFIAPMMYFKEAIFKPFMKDWKSSIGNHPVCAGIALYMMDDRKWPIEIIENEINYSREISSGGQVYFRTENLIKNTKGCADLLKLKFYIYPSLLPPIEEANRTKPTTPQITSVVQKENELLIDWSAVETHGGTTYNVYASDQPNIDINDVRNLIVCRMVENKLTLEIPDDFHDKFFLVVTASDRLHNESTPSKAATVIFMPKQPK